MSPTDRTPASLPRPVGASLRCAIAWALCAAALLLAPATSLARRPAHRRVALFPGSVPVNVSFARAHPGAPVPQDFLGLSFEVAALPQLAGYAANGNLATMLRSLGVGVLRFGGVSADTITGWSGRSGSPPSWASGSVGARDLRGIASLASQTGWHVLLTLGLAHYEPEEAAHEAATAKVTLGEWLEGIELGNEPNSYAFHGLRPEPWTFVQYDAEVAGYRSAIEAAAPGIPLAGPDNSGSSAYESWGLGEAVDQRPALLTGHHYPLGCNGRVPATITNLLSPQIRRLEVRSLRKYISVAEASETPFRLDETNTVSCGGVAGVSNTFASALWAVDYVARAMSMGVAGINLHGNPSNCLGYTPLCAPTAEGLAAGTLQAQPEWYALLLTRALIGTRPLTASFNAPGHRNVDVMAFLAADGRLRFVIVDDDPPWTRSLAVRLPVGTGFGNAQVLSLTAPTTASLSGVLLGGQAVAPDGTWTEPARLPRAPNRHGTVTVQVKPGSAALVTVWPRGG